MSEQPASDPFDDARVVRGGGDAEQRAAAIAVLVSAVRSLPDQATADRGATPWRESARGLRQPFSSGGWRAFGGQRG